MYFVKKIVLNNSNGYSSSNIITHTTQSISYAKEIFINCIKECIREEAGRITAENLKVIDILSLDQVCKPTVDSYLLYRLHDHPDKIYVYRRKTEQIQQSGWVWGASLGTVDKFDCVFIFELEEYQIKLKLSEEDDDSRNLVKLPGANIKIPLAMTVAPMVDLIAELKKSTRFIRRFETTDQLIC
jgi:hypothetical protein